jgi:hypothetical protein
MPGCGNNWGPGWGEDEARFREKAGFLLHGVLLVVPISSSLLSLDLRSVPV